MHLLRPLHPALAALLAACVLLLGLAAQAPHLHEAICQHGKEHADHADHDATHAADHAHADTSADSEPATPDDAGCAVTLFASGCDTPPHPLSLVAPALNAVRVAHFTEFMLARTLRGPARVCGPPALS